MNSLNLQTSNKKYEILFNKYFMSLTNLKMKINKILIKFIYLINEL